MKTIGWGVLGCGDITDKRGAPAINADPHSRLISFQSRSAAQAEGFAASHHSERWTTHRSELLADPEVDAVHVATEHHRHCEDVLAAAEAGKHVLCEKPLATSVEDGRRMIEVCRANGVALQVAYYRRYYPKMLRIKELLDEGVIGQPVSAHIHLSNRLAPESITPANWRIDASRSGGGNLVDTGSHRLDLLCWLLGEPARVAALTARAEMPIQAPDMETLLIEMANAVHVTAVHGFRHPSEDRFEIWGTEGVLDATPVDGPELRLRSGPRTGDWKLPRHDNVHYPLFADFSLALVEGRRPRYTGEDGLQATRIIEAAYLSADEGRFVAA